MGSINILICGAYSALTLKMISRLRQERHEIFVITGKSASAGKRVSGVFQEYNFEYTSMGIAGIVQNVSPDLVIFMGALDEYFTWEDERQQAVEFISGLTNLLIASWNAGVPRFIYGSSAEVYEDNTEVAITLDTVPTPSQIRIKSYLQGEDTCKYYDKEGTFEISIVRVCEIYGSFFHKNVHGTVCYEMVDELLKKGSIPVRKNRQHNLMYLDDAVEALYQVLRSRDGAFRIYHVLGTCCTEQEIADIMQSVRTGADIRDVSCDHPQKRKELEPDLLHTVADFEEKYTLEQGIRKYIEQAPSEERKIETHEKQKKILTGNRIFAVAETVCLVISAWFLTSLTRGSVLGESIDFYLLAVVIISVVHGSFLGFLAVFLSVSADFGGIIAGSGIVSLVMDYSKYLWMVQLLIVGVTVSFVKDNLKRKTMELEDENRYQKKELETITKINESNVYVKNIFEKRLINYKNSLAKIYDITSKLDYLSVQKVVFEAVEVVKEIMQTKEVSIYMAGGNSKYLRLTASTSDRAAGMGKSICIEEGNPLYEGFLEEGYYRNKELNPEFPMLAATVMNGKQIRSIIMVWSLELEGANLYQANLLAILCRLIEKSMRQAQTYMDAIRDDTYIQGSRALNAAAFEQMLELYRDGQRKKLLEYALVQVVKDDIPMVELLKMAEKGIRATDYLGLDETGKLYLLLTNSRKEDLKYVIGRFQKDGMVCHIIEAWA